MPIKLLYRGFTLALSNSRGGKAGTGKNKTATVQVREMLDPGHGFFLRKQVRFKVGDKASRQAAINRAKHWIDGLWDAYKGHETPGALP
jgi:hypothetical protein